MFDTNTKVLVVDDMLTMRKLVAKICKEIGFNDVTLAADGEEAWKLVTTTDPGFGLIISDWNMPKKTGLEFLKLVRGDAKYSSLPFVLVTAEAEQHQIMEALKAGVSSYVVKPFTAATLKEKLDALSKKKAS